MTIEVNALNLFDEANVLGLFNTPAGVNPSISTLKLPVTDEPAALNYILTSGIVSQFNTYLNDPTAPQRKNSAYGMANSFQGPRVIRFALKFAF